MKKVAEGNSNKRKPSLCYMTADFRIAFVLSRTPPVSLQCPTPLCGVGHWLGIMRAHLTGTSSADTPLCGVSAREKVFRKQITTRESAVLNVSPLPTPLRGVGSGETFRTAGLFCSHLLTKQLFLVDTPPRGVSTLFFRDALSHLKAMPDAAARRIHTKRIGLKNMRR